MPDKTLKCVDCGKEFVFSQGQQEHFAQLGFKNEPKRCFACRLKRKKERMENQASNLQAPRVLHEARCNQCGGIAKVPFKPMGNRPVYCSDCFAKKSTSHDKI